MDPWFKDFPITADALRLAYSGNRKNYGKRYNYQISYLAKRIIYAYVKAFVLRKDPFPVYCKDFDEMDGILPETDKWFESIGFKVFVKDSGTFYIHFVDHTPA